MKERYRERLPLLAPMRRKLVDVPLHLDYPYWTDEPDLDLDDHVRSVSLPPPGDDEHLAELVAELTPRPLDRSRPLWQLYVIDGLPDGRIAHLTLCHHASADGVGFVRMVMNLLDHDADGGHDPIPEPTPDAAPTTVRMVGHALTNLVTQPLRGGRAAARLLPALPRLAVALRHASLREAPSTPFNERIGANRAVAFTSVSLPEVRMVKDAVGVTVNDVVLAMCAGALTGLPRAGRVPARRAAPGDGPGEHPHRRRARRVRQPGGSDHRIAAHRRGGSDRAAATDPRDVGGGQAVRDGDPW